MLWIVATANKISNDEIITVVGITAIVFFIGGLLVTLGDKLTEIKDNTPVVFWFIITGIIIAIPLLIFGCIKLYLYIKDKGYF